MRIKKVNELNKSKMFDDHYELLQHGDKYVDDVYVKKTSAWNKHFREVMEGDTGYVGISHYLKDLLNIIRTEEKIIENFIEDCKTHINELDEIYQNSGELSEEDDKVYDELEELQERLNKMLSQIEPYTDSINEVIKSYQTLDERIGHLRRYEWKLPM